MGEFYTINTSKKWPDGTNTYEVSVTHHPTRGSQLYIPEPIMHKWGFPEHITFVVHGDSVTVRKS